MSPKFRMLCFPMLFMQLIGSGQQADTNQWNRFRGSNGLGIESLTHLPAIWDSTDFKWKMPLPGVGHASPVIWGDMIVVTSSDDSKKTGYINAADQQT